MVIFKRHNLITYTLETWILKILFLFQLTWWLKCTVFQTEDSKKDRHIWLLIVMEKFKPGWVIPSKGNCIHCLLNSQNDRKNGFDRSRKIITSRNSPKFCATLLFLFFITTSLSWVSRLLTLLNTFYVFIIKFYVTKFFDISPPMLLKHLVYQIGFQCLSFFSLIFWTDFPSVSEIK